MKFYFIVLIFLIGCFTGNVVYEIDGRPIITNEELAEGFNLKDTYRFHLEKGTSINLEEINVKGIDYVVEFQEEGYRFWFNPEGPHGDYLKYPQFKKFDVIVGGKLRSYQIVPTNETYLLRLN